MCSESISVTSFWLLYRDIRNPYTPNMMYDSAAAELTGALVCCSTFSFLGGGQKKKSQATKSRIICTFSIVEKVRPIRQLKKEAITLDEDG